MMVRKVKLTVKLLIVIIPIQGRILKFQRHFFIFNLSNFEEIHQILYKVYKVYKVIVMFLQEFQGQATKDKQSKKARRQYSGGFRNYHPQFQKTQQAGYSTTNQSDFFDRLNIGNIKQIYLADQPPPPNLHKALYQSQQQAINRLTITKKQEQRAEIEDINEEGPQNRQKFMKTYHKSPDFQQKANSSLVNNQLKRVQQKFAQKHKKIQKEYSFEACLTFFVIKYCQKLLNKELSTDELYLNYCNFINQLHGSKKLDEKQITLNSLDYNNLILKNFYLFCKFKKGPEAQSNLSYSDIINLIRANQETQSLKNHHFVLKLLNKKYTVPYQTQLYKESRKASIIDQIDESGPIVQNQIFHAKPIPKTTYQKPRQRPQSAFAKTNQKPFNLSEGHQKKKGIQQYYNWDRTFHAREAPKTTYDPKLINTLNESEKKRRQQQLLHKAAFPPSMNYLEDYKQYMNKKKGQLSQKYLKQFHLQITRKEPPNFEDIHRQHLSSLEDLKIENRHTTVPKPFNLSKPKERKQPNYLNNHLQRDHAPPSKALNTTSSKLQPQSTMKYQALVALRKRQKQQKLNKKQEAAKKQKKQQQQKKIYKQLLKQRIDNEIHNIPQKKTYNDAIPSNKIKVDLEKIYTMQPLLIERQSAKNKNPAKAKQIGWDPII